jgi:hypothetical protein
MNSKPRDNDITLRAKMDSVLAGLPAPIIHNKRLGEIVYALMVHPVYVRRHYQKPKHLDILTCHNYQQKALLERSLEAIGVEGFIRLIPIYHGPWRNTLKIRSVLQYLKDYPNGPEFVLFCDADDVIIKEDPQKAVDIFESKQCDLLFMSTSFTGGYACMPEVKRWADHIFPGRYLNSGVYIGKRRFMISVLQEAERYITQDDITAEESQQLGHGVSSLSLCDRLPNYPYGSQDQDIFRYIQPEFYPEMQVDFHNELAFRNL